MEHRIVELRNDHDGIPKGTKGVIVWEYSRGVGTYEVEFIVNGETVCEMLTDEDIVLI